MANNHRERNFLLVFILICVAIICICPGALESLSVWWFGNGDPNYGDPKNLPENPNIAKVVESVHNNVITVASTNRFTPYRSGYWNVEEHEGYVVAFTKSDGLFWSPTCELGKCEFTMYIIDGLPYLGIDEIDPEPPISWLSEFIDDRTLGESDVYTIRLINENDTFIEDTCLVYPDGLVILSPEATRCILQCCKDKARMMIWVIGENSEGTYSYMSLIDPLGYKEEF